MQMFSTLQDADQAPTSQAIAAVAKVHQSTETVLQQWKEFVSEDLVPLKIQQ
jgi:hypothetical protein